ncbi:MAG: PAS domain S-box protein [Desulfotignum sp.]|nr:PAS domain S-box protein [Desulfotignum sp.]
MTSTEKKFKTIIENIEDGYYEVDLAGNFVSFNQAMCDILGYTADELTGLNNRTFMDNENARKVFATFNQVYQTQKGCKAFDWQLIKKDGTLCHVDISVSLLTGTDGEPIGFHGIARDITEQKNLDIRLEQSRRMEAIGTLAAGISHDFNNILSGIFGYAQLAKNSVDNPQKAKEHIDQVIKAAHRAAELVQQVLTFSRRADYLKKPFRIYLIIKESVKLLRSSLPATIEIKTRLESRQMVLADPTKMHQVIMNLCLNAYQAMKKKGGVLTVCLTEETITRPRQIKDKYVSPGDYLKLEVSDTGHGMDAKTLEKVFNPDNRTRKKGRVTGMGLSAVQAFVDEYDGFLEVNSEPGRGTTVQIGFPVAGTEKKQPSSDMPVPKISQNSSREGTETIMLVDDEKAIRQIFEEFLQNHGYKVRLFENGIEALKAFEADPKAFDLIITDMTMPELTGDRLSRKILKIRPDVPIILWCGFSEDISEDTAVEMGIKKYIQKPVSPGDLLKTIQQILDGK